MRLAPLLAILQLGLAPCAGQVDPSPHHRLVMASVDGCIEDARLNPEDQIPQDPESQTQPPEGAAPAGNPASTSSAPNDGSGSAAQPVPEPSTMLLVITGLVGLILSTCWRRRRVETTGS